MTGRPHLQVAIPTANRPQFLPEAVHSVLAQDHPSFRVVVSDNSTTGETWEICRQFRDPRLTCRRRQPPLPVLDHMTRLVQERDGDYFMMFHDDDRMMPGALRRLSEELDRRPACAAVVGNARFLREGRVTNQRFVKPRGDRIIGSPRHLGLQYLVHGQFAPFPAYLYRSEFLDHARFAAETGGKYSDITFLMEVVGHGPICFLDETVMHYRIHSTRASSSFAMADRRALLRTLLRAAGLRRGDPRIVAWRLDNLEHWYQAKAGTESRFHPDRLARIRALKVRVMPFRLFRDLLKDLVRGVLGRGGR